MLVETAALAILPKRIQGLQSSNPLEWWRETRSHADQTAKCKLSPFVNNEANGDIQALANIINDSLQRVSCDLTPLPDSFEYDIYTIPILQPIDVFYKLSNINVQKSPGPDGIPN